jgi:iron complex transport system ATP-binding protein
MIDVRNLKIGYTKPRGIVAEDINFKIEKSGLIGVIGVNGSGKSTLLKTLANLNQPIEGEVLLNGKPIASYSPNHYSKLISVVLSKQTMSQNLSVEEFVTLGRHPYNNWLGINEMTDKKHIIKALQQVDLTKLRHKKCDQLSDGQFQKVMIARALAQDTPIILLDEPTTHLDMYHKISILKLLKEISTKDHKTILFSTHELNLALQLCDDMICIKHKAVVHKTTKEMVEGEDLEDLFPDDLITLDKKSGIFKMKTD